MIFSWFGAFTAFLASQSPIMLLVLGHCLLQSAISVGRVPPVTTFVPPTNRTWYVRSDGGTRFSVNVPLGQCDGLADVSYASTGGTGVNQHCAYNDFRYMWDDDSGLVGSGAWVIIGGDTVVVRGCTALPTQQNPANPTCRVGWDESTGVSTPPSAWCAFVGSYTCHNPTIPAGNSSHHTKILGACAFGTYTCNSGNDTVRSNLQQIFSGFSLDYIFNMTGTQYLDVEGIEFTTHNGACSLHGSPQFPSGCAVTQPLSDYGNSGLHTDNLTSHITLQDVLVDGFESSGIFGPIGGPITMTRVNVSYNFSAGWNFDDGISTPNAAGSSITASYVTMIGNGCKQEYPIVDAFAASACWDDSSNGFGDAWSGQNTTLDSFICDHCIMMYNTKDGFIGPHTQVGTLTVTNSVSIGNMGAQMKYGTETSAHVLFENNIFDMNCRRMSEQLIGAAQNFNISTGLGGSYLSDFCRAGDGWSFLTRALSVNSFIGNTIVAAVPTIFDMNCGFVDAGGVHEETNCNTTLLQMIDNQIIGYVDPSVGAAPGLFFFDPGAAGSLTTTNTNNNYFGVRNITPDVCGTAGITCVDPLLQNEPSQTWPGSQAALDIFLPASGSTNANYPTSLSPLLLAGVPFTGFTLDFYGSSRGSSPTMGAVETASAGCTFPVTDNFAGTGPLGIPWSQTTATGQAFVPLTRVSGAATTASGGTAALALYTGCSFGTTQSLQVNASVNSGGNFPVMMLNTSVSGTGIGLAVNTGVSIVIFNNGNLTGTLASCSGIGNGDLIQFAVVGNTYTATDLTVGGSPICSISFGSFVGTPGLFMYWTGTPETFSNFQAN